MGRIEFRFYADKENRSRVLLWLDEQPQKVQEKFLAGMGVLSALGHESRRPLWAPLRGGIFELRVQHLRVQYRMLCFFHGREAIIAAHGCTKHRAVDPADIDRAIEMMARFKENPKKHTYVEKVTVPANPSGKKDTAGPNG